MTEIDPNALDRYITGNWGEDQYASPPHDCNCVCHSDGDWEWCDLCKWYHIEMEEWEKEMEKDQYEAWLKEQDEVDG